LPAQASHFPRRLEIHGNCKEIKFQESKIESFAQWPQPQHRQPEPCQIASWNFAIHFGQEENDPLAFLVVQLQQERSSQVQPQGAEQSRQGHARVQAWEAQVARQAQGEESQTGDRHRHQ
jgi:hypothetical protein